MLKKAKKRSGKLTLRPIVHLFFLEWMYCFKGLKVGNQLKKQKNNSNNPLTFWLSVQMTKVSHFRFLALFIGKKQPENL
jgi:hypothetical protein